jgi:hypothetical protein
MHQRWKSRTILLIIIAIAAVMMLCPSVFGQCSMCRTSLAGSDNAFFIRNFNIGVLVLLVPPVTIFCSIFIALKRYRATDEEDKQSTKTPDVEG